MREPFACTRPGCKAAVEVVWPNGEIQIFEVGSLSQISLDRVSERSFRLLAYLRALH